MAEIASSLMLLAMTKGRLHNDGAGAEIASSLTLLAMTRAMTEVMGGSHGREKEIKKSL